MGGEKTNQKSSKDRKRGTRKLFYGAIGLLLAGLMLVGIGAVYGWPLLMLVGVAAFLGAGVVQLIWLVRVIG